MSRFSLVGLVALSMLALVAQVAEAKRGAPKPVAPVRHGGLEFRAPHDLMGSIEAVDAERGVRAWYRQIYVVARDLSLETDVQDVYVTKLQVIPDRDVLEVTNERGWVYELDLKTFEVKTIKGQPVVRWQK